jgi:alanine dehydrogenase
MALGLGADVAVLYRSHDVLDRLAARFGPALTTVYSTRAALEDLVVDADLVIGAVLVPGARAPHLVTAEMVKHMRPGSVVVDVAIDQGGCFETSRPTTHTDPTYVVNDVVHYCVANMPGAVARTSAHALNNVTLPHVIALADHGLRDAMATDPHLRAGLNVFDGQITDEAVAEALGHPYVPAEQALGLPS